MSGKRKRRGAPTDPELAAITEAATAAQREAFLARRGTGHVEHGANVYAGLMEGTGPPPASQLHHHDAECEYERLVDRGPGGPSREIWCRVAGVALRFVK